MVDQTKLALLKAREAAKQIELTQAETRRETAAQQINTIDSVELAALGVKPKDAESELARLDSVGAAKLKEAEELLAGMNQPGANG